MKKFEIINDKWIKTLNENNNRDEYSAIKINDITLMASRKLGEDSTIGSFSIYIRADSNALSFYYKKSEEEQYKSDLKILENLLFNS